MPHRPVESLPPFDALESARNDCLRLMESILPSLDPYVLLDREKGAPATVLHTTDDRQKKNRPGKRPSVASTATTLNCLASFRPWANADLMDQFPDLTSPQRLGELVFELVQDRNWNANEPDKLKLPNHNPFDISFALEGTSNLLAAFDEDLGRSLKAVDPKSTRRSDFLREFHEAGRHLIKNILGGGQGGEARPAEKAGGKTEEKSERGAANISPYPPTAFLTQLAVRGLLAIRHVDEFEDFPCNCHGRCIDEVQSALRAAREWAVAHTRKQLVLLQTDSPEADHYELLHAVLIFAMLDEDGTPNERGYLHNPEETRLARAALGGFMALQDSDGSWPRGRALFHYNKIGDAYCYQFEALAQLLQCKPLWPLIHAHVGKLLAALDYAVDPALHSDRERVRQWASGHRPHMFSPESWSTASVFQFAQDLKSYLAEVIRISNSDQFGRPVEPPRRASKASIDDVDAILLDSQVPRPGTWPRTYESYRCILKDGILKPLLDDLPRVQAGGTFSDQAPVSILLFGPPGTSKTETARIVAELLHWPLVRIDPSHFLREGLDRVQSQATRIFQRLAASEQVVVLLDEIDELVRERGPQETLESRFLTTAMLPKLIQINQQRRIVFIVATNHVEHFDLAVTREGRFDAVIQVMPPSLAAKTDPDDPAIIARNSLRGLAQALRALDLLDNPRRTGDLATIVDAMTYAEFDRLAKQFDWKNPPPDEELVAAIHGMIPSLTMFQLREWHHPDEMGCPMPPGIPMFDDDAPPEDDGLHSPRAFVDGNTVRVSKGLLDGPDSQTITYRTWHYVCRLDLLHRKNRLPRGFRVVAE